MSEDKHLRSVPDFRGDAAALVKMREARDPMILIRPGKATAVLFTMEDYKRRNAELDLSHSLAQGESEKTDGE